MQMTRRFTREGHDPFAGITFAPPVSKIANPNRSDAVPQWLQRAAAESDDAPTSGETDSRQVFHRLAGCWAY